MFLNKLRTQSKSLASLPRRTFQQYNHKVYQTGSERMLLDKFRSIPGIGHVSLFSILGLANVVGYGASLLMTKENYRYHFAYTGKDVGSAGSSRFAKSLIGSESLINTVANAGLLIGCG